VDRGAVGRQNVKCPWFWSCFASEDLETVSRRHAVTAATLSGWREAFLVSGEAGLKAHEDNSGNEETRRLKSVVADLHMDNELLREKIQQLEANRPLGWRRWKP
jgi:transposase